MSTFSNVMGTETAYHLHLNFNLFVHITVLSSSSYASCFCLFYTFLFFFTVLTDISATSSTVSVCNSGKIGDSTAHDSKTLVAWGTFLAVI